MISVWLNASPARASLLRCVSVAGAVLIAGASTAAAQGNSPYFTPDNLVVSRNVYSMNPAFGPYPFVWNSTLIDGAFGITSKVMLDQITPAGVLVNSLEVPNSTQNGVPPTKDQLVASFSSKSEGALSLSPDGQTLTFMGYLAPVDALDVSNSNTPGIIDATNTDVQTVYRLVAQVDVKGKFNFTKTNAFSGDNGRAAITANVGRTSMIIAAGNAGNGSGAQPNGILIAGGAQIMTPQVKALVAQNPGDPTPVASFNISQLGAPQDKLGKDNNFRGITIVDDVVYFTKGSGSNGVNTVYFLDTTGSACPNGVGLPVPGASLPTSPLAYDPALLQSVGLQPNNLCILKGFPQTLNSALKKKTTAYPFGLWFANSHTVYVADEGDGAYADVGTTPAGLQKWIFDDVAKTWKRAYTLQTGLGIGATYPFPGNQAYPAGANAATGLPWAPLTAGLRNITGRVNPNGTVTIWGVTSTVSGNGDPGADPNKLVEVVDLLANTSAAVAATETFATVRTAGFGEVLRGVTWTPGTERP